MTDSQLILSRLRSIEKKVDKLTATSVTPEYITAQQASKMYGVSQDLIRKLRYRGKLTDCKATRTGRKWRYSVPELEMVLAAKTK